MFDFFIYCNSVIFPKSNRENFLYTFIKKIHRLNGYWAFFLICFLLSNKYSKFFFPAGFTIITNDTDAIYKSLDQYLIHSLFSQEPFLFPLIKYKHFLCTATLKKRETINETKVLWQVSFNWEISLPLEAYSNGN